MLSPGAHIGTFEVLAPLGAGGMGEVYRARDTRLGREVAIKVLPAERLSDPTRRARFVQEAKAASALNHPHIVTIHEIESADGIDFIVMELVPGKTLDTLIPKGGMRLGEALRVAIPIADALAAAHAKGIVHRDLKPGNVMVTPDGVVKVLDFGLAKLMLDETSDGEDATTLEARAELSHPGTALGTPAYMSPEQATGAAADARSDIFSFGVVLYEMVTGRRPFAGASSAEVHAALLKEQPRPPSEIVPDVPRDLERIILRCLRKEPDRRFHHAVDMKVELQEVKEESDSQPATTVAPSWKTTRFGRRSVWSVAVVLIVAAGIAGTLWRMRRPELPPMTVVQLTSERWAGAGSFSPDGTQIAYASAGEDGANWDIWVKIVGQLEARRLTTDPAVEDFPAWSPDGEQIAFLRYFSGTMRGFTGFAAGSIHLVSPIGGTPRRLSDFPARLQLSWSKDGRWIAAAKARSGDTPPGGIHLISVDTGEVRPLTPAKPDAFEASPAFSPDGREIAYFACEGPYTLPLCHLLVQPLDAELRPKGQARRLTREPVQGAKGLAWARDSRSLLYDGLWSVRADGASAPERLAAAAGGRFPSTAGGRDRLAFVRPVGDTDIYRLPLGGSPVPLVQSTFKEVQPQYSPDGRRVAFDSDRSGREEIWLVDGDGGNLTRLTQDSGRSHGWPGWSPDGRWIVFDSIAADGNRDVWTIGVDGSGLRRITRHPAHDIVPSWSHDGRFIYFASNRTGRFEVWRAAADGGAEVQITQRGGMFPLESADGRTLYYLAGPADGPLMSRPTGGGDERAVLPCVRGFGWAVAPNGIVHHDCLTAETGGTTRRVFHRWDAATGQDRELASVTADVIASLSVAPDGRSIVYAGGLLTSDLMMIEDFR